MKKLIITAACIIVFTVAVISAYAKSEANQTMVIGTQEVKFDNPIYLIEDMTYVPIRELSEKLGIPISWNNEKGRVELDINNKEVAHNETVANAVLVNGVIPDEETAKAVAKTILEACIGKPVEYEEDDYEFYLTVSFSDARNMWIITQYAKYNGNSFGGGNVSPVICINKATGEVVAINLEPAWDTIIKAHKERINS